VAVDREIRRSTYPKNLSQVVIALVLVVEVEGLAEHEQRSDEPSHLKGGKTTFTL
jgi:DNA-binding transcriptional regulator YiaG